MRVIQGLVYMLHVMLLKISLFHEMPVSLKTISFRCCLPKNNIIDSLILKIGKYDGDDLSPVTPLHAFD